MKLSPDASQLLYATYFPAVINALAVDPAGNIYVAGSTNSPNFPVTPGLPAGPLGGSVPMIFGAFLTKISADGSRIVYSTLIAGHGKDCGAGSTCFLSTRSTTGVAVAVDPAGNAYLAGNTDTNDLPTTPGAFLAKGTGAFVAKVNVAGNALAYLTHLSATNFVFTPFANPANTATALAVDAAGNAYVTGATFDPSFPATAGAYQTTFAGPYQPGVPYPLPPTDAFAAKLNPTGTALVWATYIGGKAADAAKSVALDSSGNVWIAGATASPDFPDAQGWSGGGDFLTGLTPSGSALAYSARYPNDAVSQCVAVDASGLLHVAGPAGIVSTVAPTRAPVMRIFGIANAAAGPILGRVVPGEVISIYGPHIGPATPATFTPVSGVVPNSLAGVQVLFNGVPAPLLYVSDSQINAAVPFGVYSGTVRIVSNGITTPDFPTTIISADPEIFLNPDGTAAAVNQDGTINSPSNPAKAGSIVSIWVTGIASFFTHSTDGQIATTAQDYCCGVEILMVLDPNASSGLPPGPIVTYAGAAPGLVAGVIQINFHIAASANNFSVSAGGKFSNSASIYVSP